jgi:hypothetical protein
MSRSYTSSPPAPPWRVAGLLYFTEKRIKKKDPVAIKSDFRLFLLHHTALPRSKYPVGNIGRLEIGCCDGVRLPPQHCSLGPIVLSPGYGDAVQ